MTICVILAYYSEQYTDAVKRSGHTYSVWNDTAYILLAVVLVLFTGIRRDFNDTWNYINAFRNDKGLATFWGDAKNLNVMAYPLFYFFRSLLKELTNNEQMMIFIPSAFTQICFLLCFKRYSCNFTFSIFIYFALGSLNFSMAALKQAWAMAIMTLAFPCLEKKQWVRYYLTVFIAMMFHTYALAFAVLPLFTQKPWKLNTYLLVGCLIFVMLNFEDSISAVIEQAEDVGKKMYEEDIFYDNGVSFLRVAVYAVAPVMSFFFRRWIFRDSSVADHVLVHMSIISFAFMLMGTQAGANMFARMAQYFELGTVCCLPGMLEKTFNERSRRVVTAMAVLCFAAYFVYANGIYMRFDDMYKATSILNLLRF